MPFLDVHLVHTARCIFRQQAVCVGCWLAPALSTSKKAMEYTTNINTYELRFSGQATVSAANEGEAVEELRKLTIENCDSFYVTHSSGY